MANTTTLTNETAQKLFDLWKLSQSISDAEICDQLGITPGQLQGWLNRDIQAEIVIHGEPVQAGLRTLRTRAKAGIIAGYLEKLHGLIDSAEEKGDLSTAGRLTCWLMEKQFPKQFGNLQKLEISEPQELTISKDQLEAAIKDVDKMLKKYKD